MIEPTVTTLFDEQVAGERRIRLFVMIELFAVAVIAGLIVLFGLSHELFSGLIICGIISVIAAITYWLRSTRYSELLIYLNLGIVVVLIGVAGPLSGRIDGTSWSLFSIPPLIATIVLNRPRATLIIVVLAAITLVTAVILEITQIIPVILLIPSASLLVAMGNNLLVLAVIAITIQVLVKRANQALKTTYESQTQLHAQLQRERELTEQQEQANRELAASLQAIQERDLQIQAEAQEQQRLRVLLSELSTPVIPVLQGVVIMPLVGALEGARAQELTSTLLQGIERYNAKIVLIDVTGLSTIDTYIGKALITAAEGCVLLGATPILAGISPEVAQTLVTLNIDLRTIITVADLQSGVEYALQQRRDSARSIQFTN